MKKLDEKNDGSHKQQGRKKHEEKNDGACVMITAFTQILKTLKNNEIEIPLGTEIFGDDNLESYVFKSDLFHFCAIEPIDVTCIVAYTRETIKFVNPTPISAASKMDISKIITTRLKTGNGNEVYLIPYYPGYHWVLMIIDTSSMNVLWLDPLNYPIDETNRFYITAAILQMFVYGYRRPQPTWITIKCPKQPSEVECGYYVMKYMRELMEGSQSIDSKVNKLSEKATYTTDEINELRVEFIEFIVGHMNG